MSEILIKNKKNKKIGILYILSLIFFVTVISLIYQKNDLVLEKKVDLYAANYDYTQKIEYNSNEKGVEGQDILRLNGNYAKDNLTENAMVTVALNSEYANSNCSYSVFSNGWYKMQPISNGIKIDSNGKITFPAAGGFWLQDYVIAKEEIIVEFDSNRIDGDTKEIFITQAGFLSIKLMPGSKTNYEYKKAENGVIEIRENGDQLKVIGLKSGRATLSIVFKDENITRNIVFGVKNADGTIDENNADTGTGLSSGSGGTSSGGSGSGSVTGVADDGDASAGSSGTDARNADPNAFSDGTIAGGTIAELDRLDFLNAYEKIYNEYYPKEEIAANQIARLKSSMSISYAMLKKALAEMGDNPDKLPVVYGKSLGLNSKFVGVESGSGSSYGGFIWPIPSQVGKGTIADFVTSPFGMRDDPMNPGTQRFHNGIDLGASTGTEVVAIKAGTVVSAGDRGGYGNSVVVDHGNGYTSTYNHLDSVSVNEGDKVTSGQVVGLVGSTGNSTGPHLHFEIILNGEFLDPLEFYNDDLTSKGGVNFDGPPDEVCWYFLKSKGLTDEAAAGVLGNIQQESGNFSTVSEEFNSGNDPSLLNEGYGLFQWTNTEGDTQGRRYRLFMAAQDAGKEVSDLGFQLEYFWQEFQGYEDEMMNENSGMTMAQFILLQDIKQATDVFQYTFENAGDPQMDTRYKYSRENYTKFTGKEATT